MENKMNKLIVVVMGPGKKHFAEMCLDSIKDADKVLYWTSTQDFKNLHFWATEEFKFAEFHYNEWDETDKATNGKCRQRYLEHLKENYPDDWCLVLDEDEILDEGGIEKIKEFIKEAKPGVYNVKMRHFIGDLGHEDNTLEEHVVPGRLFRISEAKGYPLHSHPMLEGNLVEDFVGTTIWHLGHLPISYMDYILTRYKQHANDSLIHPPGFLKKWKMSHIFGGYPRKQINPMELPKQILERYELDADEFYFANRGLETKHFIDAKNWKDYFNLEIPNNTVLEIGCGLGPRIFAMKTLGLNAMGFDKSKWAVNHCMSPDDIEQGDIVTMKGVEEYGGYDLVIAYDLLEHIKYEDLDKALQNISKLGLNFLFSIPFIGDPNLEADSTHIIKETKNWWVKKLSEYFTIKDAPEDWLYSHQLLIGEKK